MIDTDHNQNHGDSSKQEVLRRKMQQASKALHEATASAEMPRYQCHKRVWALKIKSISYDQDATQEEGRKTDGSATITPEEPGYAPFKVDASFVHKHRPQEGGYYVVYDDGYKSYSPAKAFEDGYNLIA